MLDNYGNKEKYGNPQQLKVKKDPYSHTFDKTTEDDMIETLKKTLKAGTLPSEEGNYNLKNALQKYEQAFKEPRVDKKQLLQRQEDILREMDL